MYFSANIDHYTIARGGGGVISISHKLSFSEIFPPQSLLPSNVQIFNFMLINLFIIVFILLIIHCVWQNNKIINK